MALGLNTSSCNRYIQQEAQPYMQHLISIGALPANKIDHIPSVRKAILSNDIGQDIHTEIDAIVHSSTQYGPQCTKLMNRLLQLCRRAYECQSIQELTDSTDIQNDIHDVNADRPSIITSTENTLAIINATVQWRSQDFSAGGALLRFLPIEISIFKNKRFLI